MASDIGYSVPHGSLDFWKERFANLKVDHGEISEKFGEDYLTFRDPDGLNLELIVPAHQDKREPWKSEEILKDRGLRGFHKVTLCLKDIEATAAILTDLFGYKFVKLFSSRMVLKENESGIITSTIMIKV